MYQKRPSPPHSTPLHPSPASLRYNPEHDSESRLLRHRAVALQDMAHSILDHELNEDFEKVSSAGSLDISDTSTNRTLSQSYDIFD